jgi:hypothetical protein
MTEHPPTSPLNLEPPLAGSQAGLTMSDVHLLAGAGSFSTAEIGGDGGSDQPGAGAGQVAVPGLSLVVDPLGITVLKPDRSVGAVLPWAELSDVSTAGNTIGPDGVPALRVEVVAGARRHRFLVPSVYDGQLQSALAAVAPHGSAPEPARNLSHRGGRRLVLAVLGIVVLAGVALALAITVGGLKF